MADKRKVPSKSKPSTAVTQPEKPGAIKAVVAKLLDQVLGPAAQELGAVLKGEVTAFKISRAVTLAEKLKQCLEQRQINPSLARRIPYGIGSKLIRNAVEEDDDDVLKLWASLAASGIDPKGGHLNKVFISILTDITSIEVAVLRYLMLSNNTNEPTGVVDLQLKCFQTRDRIVALHNLNRLGCVKKRLNWPALDGLNIETTAFSLTDDGHGTLSDINAYFREIKQTLAQLSGRTDPKYLTLLDEPVSHRDLLPEKDYELTNLGIQLMLRCEPDQVTPSSKTKNRRSG